MDEWQCAVWPEQKMAVISPPNLIGADYPVMFISNTETGSWARFTNWYALCMTVFDGRLFRSEEHTSELQSLMRISYAVFSLKKKNQTNTYRGRYRRITQNSYSFIQRETKRC